MHRLTGLLTLALLLPWQAVVADYRVDMIVTLNRDAAADIAMTHGLAVRPPAFTDGISIANPGELKRAGISLLPDKSFGLEKEWQKLRNSRFRPVLRLAWRVNERVTATPLRLHDEMTYQVMPGTVEADVMAIPGHAQAFQRYRLDGRLLVQQSAGLRVTLDLDYTVPISAAPADYPTASNTPVAITASELAVLRLHSEKRVNLGQAHFFDHPLLGVLLRVSPAD